VLPIARREQNDGIVWIQAVEAHLQTLPFSEVAAE
jgi:hypothetical protein